MRKILAVLLVLVFAVGVGSGLTPTQAGYEDLFIQARAAAWAIYIRGDSGLQAVCSATAYKSTRAETFLVTAGHCFMDAATKTDFLVTQNHFTFIPAKMRATGMRLKQGATRPYNRDDYDGDDWAIAVASVGGKPVVPIGKSSSLVIGEDLIVVGVPFGMDFFAVQGIVGSTDLQLSTYIWNHYYGAHIFIAGGNSGSGVISTKQRRVIGILVASPGIQSSLAVFAPIDIVPAK